MEKLADRILELGAAHVGIVPVDKIKFEVSFRDMCKSNACGMYGKSWMCPPYVGEIEELIQKAKAYDFAVVFQTIDDLEDSYDFEGMMAAGAKMNKLLRSVKKELDSRNDREFLLLGAGGCRVCERCAKLEEKPCRFPNEALASLEAYGVNVSLLAKSAGMKYINGVNTVTYFGAVFMKEEN